MKNDRYFLRIAALSASATALTTFLLWLLPKLYTPPASFEEAVLLHQNSYYLSRLWVNLIHMPLALTGYFGLMLVLCKREMAKSIFGMLWFLIWGIIEMIGVAINLFSVNYDWRSNYASADSLTKNVLKINIDAFSSIWNSAFFVLLIAFLFGTFFFAWATWKANGIEKLLSYLLWLAVPLTLLIILSNYANQTWAGEITTYVYPVLQPISRLVLGLFLWKNAANKMHRSHHPSTVLTSE